MATVVTTEGLERVAQVVLDDISHIAVGTSATAPAQSDSQLGTETNRKAVGTSFRNGRVIQARAFFPNADLPTTVEEAGLFMNGSASANSGSFLVHGDFTFAKGNNDLTVVFQVTAQED